MIKEKIKNIAVVGTRDDVLPFMAVGAEVFFSTITEEIKNAVIDFSEKGYPIILVSDDFLKQMPEVTERYSGTPVPSITSIPGRRGKSSYAKERLNDLVKKAIGVDIITDREGE